MTERNPASAPEPSNTDDTALRYTLLRSQASELAEAENISADELDEMDAINQMRVVAESIGTDEYIFHTSS